MHEYRRYRRILGVLAVIAIALTSVARAQVDRMPLRGGGSFVPNAGQVIDDSSRPRPDIAFTSSANDLLLYFQSDRISYVFRSIAAVERPERGASIAPPEPDTVRTYRVDMELIGSRSGVVPEGIDPSDERIGFIHAHVPAGVQVRPYHAIIYREIYPAIDLRFTSVDDGYKYDFIVRPGGRISDIRMRYSGAGDVRIEADGRLRVTTPLGELVERAPVSFVEGAQRHDVASRFKLDGEILGIVVGDYDRSATLVIDPHIVWSTYSGGTDQESFGDVSVGPDGSMTFCGRTNGTAFPTSVGAMQTTSGGNSDNVVVRMRRDGTRAWATYLGGGGEEYWPYAAVDRAGNIFIGGFTTSTDYPATTGAHQTTYSSLPDCHLMKLDSAGNLQWATYFGGGGGEWMGRVAVDSLGNPTIVVYTSSTGLATPGAFRTTFTGTTWNTLLARFDGGGTLQWATYVADCSPVDIQLDREGSIYTGGHTSSTAYPVTTGAYQTTIAGGTDGFLASFDSSGGQRWATYLGGSASSEEVLAITFDPDGNVIVAGQTNSSDFPTTTGAFQTSHGGGGDGFVASFTSGGAMRWSTYYGGSPNEAFRSIAADDFGRLALGAIYRDAGTPLTSDELPTPRGGSEGLIVLFDTAGSRRWASRIGGSGTESFPILAFDVDVLVALMNTNSTNIPITTGAFQSSLGGSYDLYLARVCMLMPRVAVTGARSICPGDSVVLTAEGPFSVEWSNGATTRSIVTREAGSYWYRAIGTLCEAYSDTITVTRITTTATIAASGPLTFCQGGSVRLDAGTHSAYLWSSGATTREITATQSGRYHVEVMGANGCRGYDTIDVIVLPLPRPTATASALIFCPGDSVTLEVPAGYRSYWWSTGDTTRRIVVRGGGTYWYAVTDSNGCRSRYDTIVVAQHPRPVVAITPTSHALCPGDTVTLVATPGFVGYAWSTGATTPSIRVAAAGTYRVVVVDANGCRSDTASARVTMYRRPDVAIVAGGPTTVCAGDSVLLYSSRPFTAYLWSTGETTSFINVTRSGEYTLRVVDSNGCRAEATISIVVRQEPVARIDVRGERTLCRGDEVTLGVAGFATVYWSNGGFGASIRVREGGRYWAQVVDELGCRGQSDTIEIVVNERPTIGMTGPLEVCRESQATYTAIGPPDHRYQWTLQDGDGGIVSAADGRDVTVRWRSQGGILRVVVVDPMTGCRDSLERSVVVGDRIRPAVAARPSATLCAGGTVVLDAGAGYRSYRWSTGETTASIEVRSPGRYAVWVESEGGCTGTSDTVDVRGSARPDPVITIEGTASLCAGESVRLTTGEYATYSWSTGERTRSIDVRRAGTYTVIVRDSNGCEGTATAVTIGEGRTPGVSVSGPSGACPGSTATYCASGASLTGYEWTIVGGTIVSGAGASCVTVLWGMGASGSVRLRAIDSTSGCAGASAPLPVDLTAGIVPTLTISGGIPCAGDTVELAVGSGYGSYRWSTGETTPTIRVASDGTYEVTVSDTSGCTGGASIDVQFSPRPRASIDATPGDCVDGSLLDAGAGFASYRWSTGETTRTIRAMIDGAYSVEVKNAEGCGSTASIDVRLPSSPTPAIAPAGPITLCRGERLTLSASDGYASYLWSTGATTREIAVDAAGTYSVEVTDARGCRGVSNAVTVLVIDPPSASIVRRGDSLVGEPGAASYRWTRDGTPIAGAAGASIRATEAGAYRLFVTGAGDCADSSDVIVVGSANAHMTLDTVSAAVGERFVVTLRFGATPSGNMPSQLVATWSATIAFEPRSLFLHRIVDLDPEVDVDRVSPGVITLRASTPTVMDSILARLELEGLATAVPINPMVIIEASVADVEPTTGDGLVLLSGCSIAEGLAFGRAVSIVSVSPNPASTSLAVRYEAPAGSRIVLTLRDVTGRDLATRTLWASGGEEEALVDVDELPSGYYVVELRDRAERALAPIRITR